MALSTQHHIIRVFLLQLSAAEFWERYFSSKLFDRHRASSRNSVAKDDPIFDRYLEREDDGELSQFFLFERSSSEFVEGIEPLHPQNQRVQLFIDLEATEADHDEVTVFARIISSSCTHSSVVDRKR